MRTTLIRGGTAAPVAAVLPLATACGGGDTKGSGAGAAGAGADFYVTSQRAQAFGKTIEGNHPDIEIVAEQGIADPNRAEDVNAMLTKDPHLDVLGKKAPAFLAAPALSVTKATLCEGWHESLHREPPSALLEAAG